MGLDATIIITGPITDAELEAGIEEFDARTYHADVTVSRDDYGTVEVDCGSARYWGPGYERGPWPQIAGWIEAARAAFPGHVIRYGGDLVDDTEGQVMDDEAMSRFWAHWRSPHFHDYRRGR